MFFFKHLIYYFHHQTQFSFVQSATEMDRLENYIYTFEKVKCLFVADYEHLRRQIVFVSFPFLFSL